MEYGNLPQNRERIYILGFLNQDEFNSFEFPAKAKLTKSIHDCLEIGDVLMKDIITIISKFIAK